MKTITIPLFLFLSYFAFPQVGVGNTDPKAILDISASSTTSPSNEDGILIPRIDNFPSTNPTADQDGMMVFVTGNGTPAKGFYYWDDSANSWNSINSMEDADWLETGTTSIANDNNDDIYTLGKVAIGDNTADPSMLRIYNNSADTPSLTIYNTVTQNTSSFTQTNMRNYTTVAGTGTGSISSFINSTSGTSSALLYNLNATSSVDAGTSNSTHIIYRGLFTNTHGDGNRIGSSINFFWNAIGSGVTGSGDKIGYDVDIDQNIDGTHYGYYADVQKSTGYAAYLIGRTSLGTGLYNRYLMPENDGNANQVMTTDGLGNITFQDLPTYTDTDDQDIQNLSLDASNILTVGIEDGISQTVDLSALQDGTGDDWSLTGNNALSTQFIGTINVRDLKFRSANTEYMSLSTNGQLEFFNTSESIKIGEYAGDGAGGIGISRNVFVGHEVARLLGTTALDNVGIGHNALYNMSGSSNVAIGSSALRNTQASQNVGIGNNALLTNTSGTSNTAVGYVAFRDNDTGINNTGLGSLSGRQNSTGSNNTFLGANSGYSSTGDNNVFVGYQSGFNETGDNKLYIENSNADSDNALIYGEFGTDNTTSGNILRTNSQFQIGNPSGTGYAFPTTDGSNGQVLISDGTGNLTFQDAAINTDNQQIDNLGLVGTVLGISLEDDGVAPLTVDLASIDTDNQQIENFSFNSSTNILTLELEDDGQPAQNVDLSALHPTKSVTRITMNSDQSVTGAGATKVNFDTIDFDINGDFNATSEVYEVPADGIYRVTTQLTMNSSTSTDEFSVRVRIDGAIERRSQFNHSGNGIVLRQLTTIFNLSAGQTIDISFSRPLGGATISSNSAGTFFEIEQL